MSNGRSSMPNERQLFWYNLDHIKDKLLLSDEAFAKFIGISFTQYSKCRSNLSYLPTSAVFELAEKCNFHFEDLLKPNFVFQLANDKEGPIPDKYLIAPYSKLTPTVNIINYLEKTRGTRTKTNLLRKFQISDNFFQNTESRSNIRLISDVTQYLAETYKFSDEEFINMGKQTPFSPAGSLIADKLKGITNVTDMLEVFITQCATFFDKNADYRVLNVSNDFLTMECIPKKDVMEELKIRSHEFGNEEVCLTKMGCISSFSYFHFKRYARIDKLNSVYDGDESNRYIVDLAPFKKLSRALPADVLQFKTIHH